MAFSHDGGTYLMLAIHTFWRRTEKSHLQNHPSFLLLRGRRRYIKWKMIQVEDFLKKL
jgi:hypothetical protein